MYQRAFISPVPWTGKRPKVRGKYPLKEEYPTRLTVPSTINSNWGVGKLHFGEDCYIAEINGTEFVVGIIQKIKKKTREIVFIG